MADNEATFWRMEAERHGKPCPACGGNGYVEGPGCNCGVGPAGLYRILPVEE